MADKKHADKELEDRQQPEDHAGGLLVVDALTYLNHSIASREFGWSEDTPFGEVLAYFERKTPGFTKTYERKFGRPPEPAGVAELVSRETGGKNVNDAPDSGMFS